MCAFLHVALIIYYSDQAPSGPFLVRMVAKAKKRFLPRHYKAERFDDSSFLCKYHLHITHVTRVLTHLRKLYQLEFIQQNIVDILWISVYSYTLSELKSLLWATSACTGTTQGCSLFIPIATKYLCSFYYIYLFSSISINSRLCCCLLKWSLVRNLPSYYSLSVVVVVFFFLLWPCAFHHMRSIGCYKS